MAKKTTPSELHKALTTNPSSHFEHFSIKLDNGAILTGIHHFPAGRSSPPTGKPLLVGHHGATCSSHTFDTSPEDTAAIYSQMLGVPFVAFNRPNYIDSSGWLVDRSSSEPELRDSKPKKEPAFLRKKHAGYMTTYCQHFGRSSVFQTAAQAWLRCPTPWLSPSLS